MANIFKDPLNLKDNDVTTEKNYRNRRDFIKDSARSAVGVSMLVGAGLAVGDDAVAKSTISKKNDSILKLEKYNNQKLAKELTSFKHVSTYNNFYEFSLDKREPHKLAHTINTDGWEIEVSGHCSKAGKYDIDTFKKLAEIEERIYRFRCVEAWSMVIPWQGMSLASLLKKFEPTNKAKYVSFTTLLDEKQMPNQNSMLLDWPYVEGLRMDEAMHPLAFMATGLYGKDLPKQNGAPLRLVVPWKYGFKYIKSIVKIEFTENEPPSTWNISAPNEYGFYANVNPSVAHPRWSQESERVIGAGLFANNRNTDMFNSYSDVADLYKGMDLVRNF